MSKIALTIFISMMLCAAMPSCKKSVSRTVPQLGKSVSSAATVPTQWYVAPDGSSLNNGTDPSTPKNNIREVAALTKPGDFVNIMSGHGVFQRNGTEGVIMSTTISGTPGNVITFRGYPIGGPKPIIVGSNVFNAVGFSGGVSYIDVDGIEVTSIKTGLYGGQTLNQAGADDVANRARLYYTSHGNSLKDFVFSESDIAYQTNGIALDDSCHHINIRNCYVHDMPGGGISGKTADYLTIENNTVVNCAEYCLYGSSGISVIYAFNYDSHASTTQPILIRNNLCYGNRVKTICYTSGNITDGNGIIADINLQLSGNKVDYLGNTRIEDNVSYCNGGAGVNVTGSQNIYVVNNTTCNNGLVMNSYGELQMTNYCKNIVVTNNILYARNSGRPYNTFTPSSPITFDYNLYYPYNTTYSGTSTSVSNVVPNTVNTDGSASSSTTTHSIVSNPIFAGMAGYSTPATLASYVPAAFFKLQASSPAKDIGRNAGLYYAYFDYENYWRNGLLDLGAFEYH